MDQELVGRIALVLLLILIISLNVLSYVTYALNPSECFSNPPDAYSAKYQS